MKTAVDTSIDSRVEELAQLLYFEQLSYLRQTGFRSASSPHVAWSELERHGLQAHRENFLLLARCGVAWAALDSWPVLATDKPVVAPSFVDRLKEKLVTVLLDNVAGLCIIAAMTCGFCLGARP